MGGPVITFDTHAQPARARFLPTSNTGTRREHTRLARSPNETEDQSSQVTHPQYAAFNENVPTNTMIDLVFYISRERILRRKMACHVTLHFNARHSFLVIGDAPPYTFKLKTNYNWDVINATYTKQYNQTDNYSFYRSIYVNDKYVFNAKIYYVYLKFVSLHSFRLLHSPIRYFTKSAKVVRHSLGKGNLVEDHFTIAGHYHAAGVSSLRYALGSLFCSTYHVCGSSLRRIRQSYVKQHCSRVLYVPRRRSLFVRRSLFFAREGGGGIYLARSAFGVWPMMAASHGELYTNKPP